MAFVEKCIEFYYEEILKNPYRVMTALLIILLFIIVRKQPIQETIELRCDEIEDQIRHYHPEPLVPDVEEYIETSEKYVILGPVGQTIRVKCGNTEINCANFATQNCLGLANSKEFIQDLRHTIDEYGVGTCGPCGFYGTLDMHLHLGRLLSSALGVDSALIYSQSSAAVSSVIPCFVKFDSIVIAYVYS